MALPPEQVTEFARSCFRCSSSVGCGRQPWEWARAGGRVKGVPALGTAGTRGQPPALQWVLAGTQHLVLPSSSSAPGKLPPARTGPGRLPSSLDITESPADLGMDGAVGAASLAPPRSTTVLAWRWVTPHKLEGEVCPVPWGSAFGREAPRKGCPWLRVSVAGRCGAKCTWAEGGLSRGGVSVEL